MQVCERSTSGTRSRSETRAQRLSGMAVAASCAPQSSEAALESSRKANLEVPKYFDYGPPELGHPVA